MVVSDFGLVAPLGVLVLDLGGSQVNFFFVTAFFFATVFFFLTSLAPLAPLASLPAPFSGLAAFFLAFPLEGFFLVGLGTHRAAAMHPGYPSS